MNRVELLRRLELIGRVVNAGKADRFQLREVCPTDLARFATVFEWLVQDGFIERVVVKCGVWFLRLTPEAVACWKSKRAPTRRRGGYVARDSTVESASFGYASGRRHLRSEAADLRERQLNEMKD